MRGLRREGFPFLVIPGLLMRDKEGGSRHGRERDKLMGFSGGFWRS